MTTFGTCGSLFSVAWGGSEELKACDVSRARKRAFLPSVWAELAFGLGTGLQVLRVGLDDIDFDLARRFLKQQSAGAYPLLLNQSASVLFRAK